MANLGETSENPNNPNQGFLLTIDKEASFYKFFKERKDSKHIWNGFIYKV